MHHKDMTRVLRESANRIRLSRIYSITRKITTFKEEQIP